MKIQLQSLRVVNCGPLRDVCIHFNTNGDSPTTVLAGANGSGKTTVLELIATLSEMLHPRSRMGPRIMNKETTILDRTEYAQLDLKVDGRDFSVYHGKSPTDTVLPDEYEFLTRPSKKRRQPLETEGEIADRIEAALRLQVDGVLAFPDKNLGLQENDEDLFPSILYFPHNRSFIPIDGDQMSREETTYQWVYRYEVVQDYAGSLDSYLIWLEYAEPQVFERVASFLNSLDIDGKSFSVSRKDLKALVTTPKGGKHFLEELSSGEQNLLIMLMELRRRLIPHSIVLIDEIENSLHQAFQKKLAQALKRMQEQVPFQLIVTTHSVPIVESFGPASVRILTEF